MYLKPDEAFRIALGQVLFYGHTKCDVVPGLMMLLDSEPDVKRLALASRLGIAVVVERERGKFYLLNAEVAPALSAVFLTSAVSIGT